MEKPLQQDPWDRNTSEKWLSGKSRFSKPKSSSESEAGGSAFGPDNFSLCRAPVKPRWCLCSLAELLVKAADLQWEHPMLQRGLGRGAGAGQDNRDSEEWVLSHAPMGLRALRQGCVCLVDPGDLGASPPSGSGSISLSTAVLLGTVVLFQGLFLEPSEDTLAVWWKEEAETCEGEGAGRRQGGRS